MPSSSRLALCSRPHNRTHGDQMQDLLCVQPSQLHGDRPRTDVNDIPVPARNTKNPDDENDGVHTQKNNLNMTS